MKNQFLMLSIPTTYRMMCPHRKLLKLLARSRPTRAQQQPWLTFQLRIQLKLLSRVLKEVMRLQLLRRKQWKRNLLLLKALLFHLWRNRFLQWKRYLQCNKRFHQWRIRFLQLRKRQLFLKRKQCLQ